MVSTSMYVTDSPVACGSSFIIVFSSESCVKFLAVIEVPVPAVVSIADWFTELLVLLINALAVVLVSIPRFVVASRVSSLVV